MHVYSDIFEIDYTILLCLKQFLYKSENDEDKKEITKLRKELDDHVKHGVTIYRHNDLASSADVLHRTSSQSTPTSRPSSYVGGNNFGENTSLQCVEKRKPDIFSQSLGCNDAVRKMWIKNAEEDEDEDEEELLLNIHKC